MSDPTVSNSMLDFNVIDPLHAFQEIEHAIEMGREIVPLIGAGLSIEAGVPGSLQLGEYLGKVRYMLKYEYLSTAQSRPEMINRSPSELADTGWPQLEQIDHEILSYVSNVTQTREPDRDTLERIVEQSTAEELVDLVSWPTKDVTTAPSSVFLQSHWRTMLRRLSAGDSAVVDRFFSNLTRGRTYSTGHVFLAWLAKTLNFKLILTTNLDTLIESAFAAIGESLAVFEVPEDGTFPTPAVVGDDVALLKLHGGRFNVRFTDALDTPFSNTNISRFESCFSQPPLLLVLGYRGADRRAMSLVSRSLTRSGQTCPRVLWVSRRSPSLQLQDPVSEDVAMSPLKIVRYSSCGLFLQELLLRTYGAYPPSVRSYSAMTQPHPRTHRLRSSLNRSAVSSDVNRASIVVVFSERVGTGGSTWLADFAGAHERSHHVIWCDLEEFSSVDALMKHVLEQLHRLNRQIAPVHVPACGTASPTWEKSRAMTVQRFANALRGGKYLVAIDSMAEFGRANVAHDVSTPAANVSDRYEDLCEFLLDIARLASRVGQSKICFNLSPVAILPEPEESRRVQYNLLFPATADHRRHDGSARGGPMPSWHRTRAFDEVSSTSNEDPAFLQNESTYPNRIGRFRVLGLLGRGGFGDVFKVEDDTAGMIFAAKVLTRTRQRKQADRQRHVEEARKTIALNHPQIVRVYYVEDPDHEPPYMILEYVPHGTLANQLGRSCQRHELKELRREYWMQVLVQVANALHYAHSSGGLLHCDVKPANILLDEGGNAKVADFGLAVPLRQTDEGVGRGTPTYMSPEQFDEKVGHVGPTTDVYGLGAVMYELLTLRAPFIGNKDDLPAQIVTQLPQDPTEIDESIPPVLAHICMKCLRKRPGDRYRNAKELGNAIQSWLTSIQSQQMGGVSTSPIRERIVRVYHSMLNKLRSLSEDPGISIVVSTPGPFNGYYQPSETEKALGPILDVGADVEQICARIEGRGNTVVDAVRVTWNSMKQGHQTVLAISSAFRRPRSISELRRICELALRKPCSYVLDALTRVKVENLDVLLEATNIPIVRNERVTDGILCDLEAAEFLVRQEGGCYWMHSAVRDAVYRECIEKEPQGMANLHAIIAYTYYERIYRPTHDIRAFYEYLFHQLCSIHDASAEQLVPRLKSLVNALFRERSHIIADYQSGAPTEWIQTIRDVEFCRLRRACDRDKAISARIASEIDRIISDGELYLHDLEGAVYRRASDYRSCIQVRMAQIESEVIELMGRNADVELKTVDELCNTIEQSSDHWGRSYPEKLREGNHRFESILDKLCVLHAPPSGGIRPITRLIEHIVDVAICYQLLGWHRAARTLHEIVKGSVQSLEDSSSNYQGHFAGELIDWATRTRCACSIRMMESWNAESNLWHNSAEREEFLENVRTEYRLAMDALGRFPGNDAGAFARRTCALKSLVARAHYLSGHFDEAYLLLEAARAAVYGETASAERMELAMCEVRWAECLVLHANKTWLSGADPRVRRNVACDKLDLANSSAKKARQILFDTNCGVWRWTLLHFLEAQLSHEHILLSLAINESRSRWQRQRSFLTEGLNAISSALNITNDESWLRQFDALWWQLFVCFVLRTKGIAFGSSLDESWGQWKQVNERVGLGWLVSREKENRWPSLRQLMMELKIDRDTNDDMRDLAVRIQTDVIVPTGGQ